MLCMVIIPPVLTRLAGGFGLWYIALRYSLIDPSDSPHWQKCQDWFPRFSLENSAHIQLLTRSNISLQRVYSKALKILKIE